MHSDSEASAVPLAVSSSNLIFICCNYPQESCFISCHTAEADSQMQPASRSSQAARHRASLKLLNALLIPVLPWLQLVDPAFSRTMNGLWSLWLFLHAPPPQLPSCKCKYLNATLDLLLKWHSWWVAGEKWAMKSMFFLVSFFLL